MARPLRSLVPPPRWETARLEEDRRRAIAHFREERLREPSDKYREAFATYDEIYRELFERTGALRNLRESATTLLSSETFSEALRYLPGPPISLDDLKVLADAPSLSEKALRHSPETTARLVETLLTALDRHRFPWVFEARAPRSDELETAIVASSSMMAMRKVETLRRSEGKVAQEGAVSDVLVAHGFSRVETRAVSTLNDGPGPGEFCGESLLGTRKADLLVGLWDRRLMAIECKVSNSGTNSIKRLNNDAVAKSQAWRQDFGESQVVPTALLSGVYNLKNLEDAQERHLTIFWEHSLSELLAFLDRTRDASG